MRRNAPQPGGTDINSGIDFTNSSPGASVTVAEAMGFRKGDSADTCEHTSRKRRE